MGILGFRSDSPAKLNLSNTGKSRSDRIGASLSKDCGLSKLDCSISKASRRRSVLICKKTAK